MLPILLALLVMQQDTTKRRDTTRTAKADTVWIASSKGAKYYPKVPTCTAQYTLSPKNIVTFTSAKAAEKAGYTRSTSRGC